MAQSLSLLLLFFVHIRLPARKKIHTQLVMTKWSMLKSRASTTTFSEWDSVTPILLLLSKHWNLTVTYYVFPCKRNTFASVLFIVKFYIDSGMR